MKGYFIVELSSWHKRTSKVGSCFYRSFQKSQEATRPPSIMHDSIYDVVKSQYKIVFKVTPISQAKALNIYGSSNE